MQLETLENKARERNIAVFHKLEPHISLFVQWNHAKKVFYYYTVDSRDVKRGVHIMDGFTDITREEAVNLLNN